MTLDEIKIDYFDRLWPGLKHHPEAYKLKVINSDSILLRNAKILKILKDSVHEK